MSSRRTRTRTRRTPRTCSVARSPRRRPPGSSRSLPSLPGHGRIQQAALPAWDRSKDRAWGWNPKPRGADDPIRDVSRARRADHTAGQKHRKRTVEPRFQEGDFAGASTNRIRDRVPSKAMIEPEWKVKEHVRNGWRDAARPPTPTWASSRRIRGIGSRTRGSQSRSPRTSRGRYRSNYQINCKKLYPPQGRAPQRHLRHGGRDAGRWAYRRSFRLGELKLPKHVPVDRGAGASSEMMAGHRVGKRVTQQGINERTKNTFESVGSAMTFMDDRGRPMGEPVPDPRTRKILRPILMQTRRLSTRLRESRRQTSEE